MRRLDLTLTGPPLSAQSRNRVRLRAWQERVRTAATKAYCDPPVSDRDLEVLVTYFHDCEWPPLDGDNMVKPIVDALQGVVFLNDRQIVAHIVNQRDLNKSYIMRYVPLVVACALSAGEEFVYISVRNVHNMTEVPR